MKYNILNVGKCVRRKIINILWYIILLYKIIYYQGIWIRGGGLDPPPDLFNLNRYSLANSKTEMVSIINIM